MDEEIDRLVIRVRADTQSFSRDVQAMRASLDGPLEAGAERAGRAVEGALLRAARTGRLGFEDLKRTALSVLGEIAAASLRGGLDAVLGGGGASSPAAGLAGLFAGLLGGAPGRSVGGPVSPGRAYMVGERGPELFVPAASGRVVPDVSRGGPAREVRVVVNVNAGAGVGAPEALTRSSRQVARAVRNALSE